MPTGYNRTQDQFIKEANIKHNGMYDYSKVNYTTGRNKIIIGCNIHGDFLQAAENHVLGQGCPDCGFIKISNKLKDTSDDIDRLLLTNNISIKRIGEYIGSGNKIEWQCLVCLNKWTTATREIINKRNGCPQCHNQRLSNEYVDNFLTLYDLPTKRLGNYINSYTKIEWKCLTCSYIWTAPPNEIMRKRKGIFCGSGCPQCPVYKNEKRVGEALDELNIKYQKIKIYSLNGNRIHPDFYLPDFNLIIEYNGIQHYKQVCFPGQSEMDAEIRFPIQQKRDQELRDYCKENNIKLLEIDGRKYKGKHLKIFVTDYFVNGVSYE